MYTSFSPMGKVLPHIRACCWLTDTSSTASIPLSIQTSNHKFGYRSSTRMMKSIVTAVSAAVAITAVSGVATNSTTSSCQIEEYLLALQDDCGFESIHGNERSALHI